MNTIENADSDPKGAQPGQNDKTPTMSGITPEQEESDVSNVNDDDDFEDDTEEDFLEDDEKIDEMEEEEEEKQ